MANRTPLFETHVASGARIVPFGGWDMPVQYPDGIIHEVNQVRNNVGIFDVSHMARLEFSGADAGRFLDTVLSVRASRLSHGQGRYHVICNEQGGIIDDAIVYNLDEDRYLLVVNAGNADVDKEWLSTQMERYVEKAGADVGYVDRSGEIAMVAVQGPNAVEMMCDMSNGETDGIARDFMLVRRRWTASGFLRFGQVTRVRTGSRSCSTVRTRRGFGRCWLTQVRPSAVWGREMCCGWRPD